MTLPGLWVDDDEQFLQDNIPLLENHGLRIDPAHSAAEALILLRENPRRYSYLIVDLDMAEMDGVELIRHARAIHPTIPIMLASAHTEESFWTTKLETLNEPLPSIPKVFPMITSPKFGEIVEKIKHLGLRGVVEVVFKCPAQEFLGLETGHREHLVSVADQINAPHVEAHFTAYPQTGWVVVGGEPGNVLASGMGLEPDAEGLTALAVHHGFPVFAYSHCEQGVTTASIATAGSVKIARSDDPVVHSQSEDLEMTSTEIPALYSEIRELVSRSNREPELRGEIDRQIEMLRRLQEAEADELERRFEARLCLKSGTGWEFLQRVKERLGDV